MTGISTAWQWEALKWYCTHFFVGQAWDFFYQKSVHMSDSRHKYTVNLVFKQIFIILCWSKTLRLNRKLKFRSKTPFCINTQRRRASFESCNESLRHYITLQESSEKKNETYFLLSVFLFLFFFFSKVFMQNVHLWSISPPAGSGDERTGALNHVRKLPKCSLLSKVS